MYSTGTFDTQMPPIQPVPQPIPQTIPVPEPQTIPMPDPHPMPAPDPQPVPTPDPQPMPAPDPVPGPQILSESLGERADSSYTFMGPRPLLYRRRVTHPAPFVRGSGGGSRLFAPAQSGSTFTRQVR